MIETIIGIVPPKTLKLPRVTLSDDLAPSAVALDDTIGQTTVRTFSARTLRLDVMHGLLYRQNGQLIQPSRYLHPDDLVERLSDPKNWTMARTRLIGSHTVLHNRAWQNHYHFLLQTVFSTWLLSQYAEHLLDSVLIPEMPPRMIEALREAGMRNAVMVEPGLQVHVDKATIVQASYGNWSMTSPLLRPFGDHMVGRLGRRGAAPPSGRRLFVSRSDSVKRKVSNEAEMERFFADRGFEVVTLTGLSIADQVALFDSATIVAGTHGAGFSNIIFCRPRTRFIELAPSSYVNTCFQKIAQVLDLEAEFHLFTAPKPDVPHLFEWHVDLDRLARELDGSL